MGDIPLYTTIAIVSIIHSTMESYLVSLPSGRRFWIKKNMCRNLYSNSVDIQIDYIKENNIEED